MKEATGELNVTVIVVIIVGLLIAFFYTMIWPIIKTNFIMSTNCAKAICESVTEVPADGYVDCWLKGKKNDSNSHFKCVYKG